MNNQEIFEELVEKYSQHMAEEIDEDDNNAWEAHYEEWNKLSDEIDDVLEKIEKNDAYFTLKTLKVNFKDFNLRAVEILVEFLRGNGVPKDIEAEIYEVLLKLCFVVLDNFETFENQEPFWVIVQVYDTLWHQCNMSDKSDVYQLFFDLTCELLSEKYHKHQNKDNEDRYRNSIIYWILMSSRFIWENTSDFNTIFKKIKSNPLVYSGHLLNSWEQHYQEINQKV